MKASRLVAVFIVLGAALWIGSGLLWRDKPLAHDKAGGGVEAPKALFKVAVMPAEVRGHSRKIVLSGHTEADKRGTAVTRSAGVLIELKVRRGSLVTKGDVIAVLEDDGRTALVDQAKARLEQRRLELSARLRLIESGSYPQINKPQLEAELKAASAALAQAEAEQRKGEVLAPLTGVVNDVPVEVGQALQVGGVIADVIALDPMLAVVEVAERQLAGVKVGDEARVKLVTGTIARGKVRFVSPKASQQTRTYRVEVDLANDKGLIPDGVTCEVTLRLAAVEAAPIPRSALTFSSGGQIGVRVVGADQKVAFVPITIVEDGLQNIWVTGLATGAKVIVQGQDFVKEGELVEAVPAAAS